MRIATNNVFQNFNYCERNCLDYWMIYSWFINKQVVFAKLLLVFQKETTFYVIKSCYYIEKPQFSFQRLTSFHLFSIKCFSNDLIYDIAGKVTKIFYQSTNFLNHKSVRINWKCRRNKWEWKVINESYINRIFIFISEFYS